MKKFSFLCLILTMITLTAKAELTIDVNGAMRDPMPLAIAEMVSSTPNAENYGEKIREVVIADLERSGLFRIISEKSYIQKFKSIDEMPTFTDWQAINALGLVQSAITETSPTTLKIEFRLWDVFSEEQLKGQSFSTEKDNWRRVAHVIADAIYEQLTGEKGYFDTRVVYISESGPATRRVKRLAIMDQDGENHKFLTSGASMALTPRFSPNLQKVTYLSYAGETPKVYILDIETGKQKLVGHFKGMTFAPVFSPDSTKLLLSYAQNGVTNIYEMDMNSGTTKQLTNSSAIDTSPSYSPDGKKIVFNSDRGGNQQLYVMNSDGSDVKRISFGQGRYATPVWSPRGDYIAFTKLANGQFYIGVMYPDGSGERLITSGYLVEAPVWAPNGRVLMYFRQEAPSGRTTAPVKLYTIDLTGYNERMIITPADASDPAWSPLLP